MAKLIADSIICQLGAWGRWFIGFSCAGRPNFNLRSKVSDKAEAIDLALVSTRIGTLETKLAAAEDTISKLSGSSTFSAASITSICTAVYYNNMI